jgi:ribosomal protein S12 methylthiotransferase accessory factor
MPDWSIEGEDANGTSFDPHVSIMKVAGEAAERYCLSRTSIRELGFGTFQEMSPSLDPSSFRFFSDEQVQTRSFSRFIWNEQSSFHWFNGEDLVNSRNVNVPAQIIWYPLKVPQGRVEPYLFPTNTTGAACGQSLEGSTLSGMMELLERDAFMIHYLHRSPGLGIDYTGNPILTEIEQYLARFNLKLQLFCLQSDFPVIPILALIRDDNDPTSPSPMIASGLKCGVDPIRTIVGAVEEACQSRPWIRGILQDTLLGQLPLPPYLKDNIIADRALYWTKPERIKDLDFFIHSNRSIHFDQLQSLATPETAEPLPALLEFCRQNAHPVYRVDLTTPEVREHGLFVSKVVMPTLQQFYLTEPFIPLACTRWKTVPLHLGLSETEPVEPNPVPHFFL